MAEENLDPMTTLAGRQQALEDRLAQLTEVITKQAEQNTALMKSNAALLAQINAGQQAAPAPAQKHEGAVSEDELRRRAQDLAHETMLRKLGIKKE